MKTAIRSFNINDKLPGAVKETGEAIRQFKIDLLFQAVKGLAHLHKHNIGMFWYSIIKSSTP